MTESLIASLKGVKFFPYWLDSIGPQNSEAELAQNIECDLLVVGGGFTGLWTAIQAKEHNPERDVVLIEAKSVAIGASGRPGGIVSTSVMHGLGNASRLFPEDMDALEELGKDNLDGFRQTIEKYNIDCDIEWGGELTVSVGKNGLGVVDEEYDLHQQYGHEAIRLDKESTQAELNSPLFEGALWNKKRSGTVHPAKLAIGLKRVAIELGVRFYENTPLLKATEKADHIYIEVPGGSIEAKKVFLATNAFAAGHKHIRRRVAAVCDRILMTAPLSDEQFERIGWQNRQGVYDTRTQLNYMRLTKDNRVLFGGRMGYYFGDNTDPAGDKVVDPFLGLAAAFFKTFPSLEDVKFTHAWSGPIALTTRMAVHYQRYFGDKMIYTGGYSGFGVTATRFGARIGLAILDNQDIPERNLEFATTNSGYIPPEPFRWIGAKITMYALDTIDAKGGWRKPWIRMVEKMGFPLFI